MYVLGEGEIARGEPILLAPCHPLLAIGPSGPWRNHAVMATVVSPFLAQYVIPCGGWGGFQWLFPWLCVSGPRLLNSGSSGGCGSVFLSVLCFVSLSTASSLWDEGCGPQLGVLAPFFCLFAGCLAFMTSFNVHVSLSSYPVYWGLEIWVMISQSYQYLARLPPLSSCCISSAHAFPSSFSAPCSKGLGIGLLKDEGLWKETGPAELSRPEQVGLLIWLTAALPIRCFPWAPHPHIHSHPCLGTCGRVLMQQQGASLVFCAST